MAAAWAACRPASAVACSSAASRSRAWRTCEANHGDRQPTLWRSACAARAGPLRAELPLAGPPAPASADLDRHDLGDAAALFRTRWRGVVLVLVRPEPDIVARADADQLSHTLLNLLTNAAEAALAGGPAPQVEFCATTDGSTVTLTVADNGLGVAEAECEAIFRPFHTGKPDGSGIGLAIARQVALGHGGSLLLDAAGAPGAVFRLSF